MKHFRDITSYHAIGRVLDKNIKYDSDVIDFYNFLSQLIFCDEIRVSSELGPDEIKSETKRTIEKLKDWGIDESILVELEYPKDEEMFAEQQKKIAELIHNDWAPNRGDIILPGLPRLESNAARESKFPTGYVEILDQTVKILEDTLVAQKQVDDLDQIIAQSKADADVSYLVGLIFSHKPLTKLLVTNFQSQRPTKEQLLDFVSKTRNKFNAYWSMLNGLDFSSSHSRSMSSLALESSLYRVGGVVNALESSENATFKVPSAVHLLLSQFGNEPEEIVKRTLTLRGHLSEFRRKNLSNISASGSGTNLKKDAFRELEYVYSDIKNIISEQSQSRFFDINRFDLNIGTLNYCYTEYANESHHNPGLLQKIISNVKDKRENNKKGNYFIQDLSIMISQQDEYFKREVAIKVKEFRKHNSKVEIILP